MDGRSIETKVEPKLMMSMLIWASLLRTAIPWRKRCPKQGTWWHTTKRAQAWPATLCTCRWKHVHVPVNVCVNRCLVFRPVTVFPAQSRTQCHSKVRCRLHLTRPIPNDVTGACRPSLNDPSPTKCHVSREPEPILSLSATCGNFCRIPVCRVKRHRA